MEIVKGVHQIRADFQVTPDVQRYAFCYLIVGEDCWLVDSGVAGSDEAIVQTMADLGKEPHQLRGLFLTHAHPDHVGGRGGPAAAYRLYGLRQRRGESLDRKFEAAKGKAAHPQF